MLNFKATDADAKCLERNRGLNSRSLSYWCFVGSTSVSTGFLSPNSAAASMAFVPDPNTSFLETLAEYMNLLLNFARWRSSTSNFKVGDILCVRGEQFLLLNGLSLRSRNTCCDHSNVQGVYKRPVTLIVPLLHNENYNIRCFNGCIYMYVSVV